MKTINEFRATNKFCITGIIASKISAIHCHFAAMEDASIIAIGQDDPKEFIFTVRVSHSGDALRDYKVKPTVCGMQIIEHETIAMY